MRRNKIGEKRRRHITTPPIQKGYFEIYNAIKIHILDFLESKRQNEKWSTTYEHNQPYKSVSVLVGNTTMFVVNRISFDNDAVTIKVIVIGFEGNQLAGNKRLYHRTLHHNIRSSEYSKAIGDPNFFDDLDVFLVECYETYKNNEYPDSINA